MEAFREAAKEFGSRIPYEKVPSMTIYKENMNWVDKILSDNITIIDVGNTKGLVEKSRFYDDEILRIFGEVN